MKKRIFAYIIWLVIAGLLYFFENNSGTRIVLCASLAAPFVPYIRRLLFKSGQIRTETTEYEPTTIIKSNDSVRIDEPGDIRDYVPGDPINLIHWKLSAKRDKLLIRQQERENTASQVEVNEPAQTNAERGYININRLIWMPAGIILIALTLMLLIPQANSGLFALLNRLFELSEARNAYVYARFDVEAGQSVIPAVVLMTIAGIAYIALIIVSRSRIMALCTAAAAAAFQIYFGISLPTLLNVLLFTLFALWMIVRPQNVKNAAVVLTVIAVVALAIAAFLPGVDDKTEAASEKARDWLSQTAQQISGAVSEADAGEIETRHVHTRSLITGDGEAAPDGEYRLVTIEEEQISMPHWVDYMRIILMLLLTVAAIIAPFVPFVLLNARQRKAAEAQKVFWSDDISEAVCAIFQHVIAWLEATQNGAGNIAYVRWPESLPADVPDDYGVLFAQCAAAFEEASYSDHMLTEEYRQRALELLSITERWLLAKADWRQRLRLRYWECLYV